MFLEIGLILGAFPAAIAFSVYRVIGKMELSPGAKPAPESAPRIIAALDPGVAAFIAPKGFQFVEAFRFHALLIGQWVQTTDPLLRRLSVSISPAGTNYEFITRFSDKTSLTTTKTRAAFMFPRPFGSFLQSFPNASVDQLWDLHLRGEQYLIADLSLPLQPSGVPYVEAFGPAILRQIACIKSFPFWPLRGIYWFLLKRFLMLKRPIWTQDVSKLYKKMA